MTRMLAALAAVMVVTVAAAAQSALASPGGSHGKGSGGAIEVGTASAQATGEGSTATATATCPGGTKAAGGGFDAPSSGDVVGLVYESVKVHNHSWRASVQLYDPGEPSTLRLTTYVYCRAHLPATKTASTTVPTTGELQIGPTASASCPNDETAVAGGFHMPPPLIPPTVTDLFFDSLRSGVSGWDARVVTGPAGPSAVTSEAYCSKAAAPPLETTGVSAPSALDSEARTAIASCPPGLSPAAGGFAQPESGPISFYFIYSSMRIGETWQVSGLHSGTEPAVAFGAAAYCA
jgi:hypothetical protein